MGRIRRSAVVALCVMPMTAAAQDRLPSPALQMELPSASLDRRPPDGSLARMRVFHDFSPGRSMDGLSIDSAGNVYGAGGLSRVPKGATVTLDTKAGIHVFAPDGKPLRFIPVPEDSVTNCCFGGADLRTLYVTAGKTLFKARVEVPGTRR